MFGVNAKLLINVIILAQGNATLASLTKQGFTYAQIANAIKRAEEMGFLSLENNKLIVTARGKNYIRETNRRHLGGGSSIWIVPQGQNYKKPLDRHAIVFKKKKS